MEDEHRIGGETPYMRRNTSYEEKHLVWEETPRMGRSISFVSVLQSFVLYRVFSKKH